MSNAPAPTFGKRGAEAVKQSGGSSFNTNFFSIGDGERELVRFLTDYQSWPQFLQHQNIPTKAKPADFKGASWPSNMPAPCRKDPQFGDVYSDCYICDVVSQQMDKYKKPSQRYWALGALREPVVENGQTVGYRDKTVSITRKNDKGEEETTKEKAIVVFNMGWKNFFSVLDGYGSLYGTILDRDFWVIRKGEMLDTTYTIIPIDAITINLEGEKVPFDLRNPALMTRYLPNALELGSEGASDERLGEIIGERASDDFYGLFFDQRVSAAPSNSDDSVAGGVTTSTTQITPAPSNDLAPEEVSSLVDRIKGYKTPTKEAAEQVPAIAGLRDFS